MTTETDIFRQECYISWDQMEDTKKSIILTKAHAIRNYIKYNKTDQYTVTEIYTPWFSSVLEAPTEIIGPKNLEECIELAEKYYAIGIKYIIIIRDKT